MREDIDHAVPDTLNRTGCALLASGIVRQAVKDWQDAVEMLEKVPDHFESRCMKTECEMFFRSEWFQEIREFAPDAISVDMMRRLKR